MWWKVLNIQTQPAIDINKPVKASRCTIKITPKNAITKLDNRAIKVITLNIGPQFWKREF